MRFSNLILLATFWVAIEATADSFTRQEAIDKRLQPMAEYVIVHNGGDTTPASVKKILEAFDPVKKYNTVCAACHLTGAAGAPKLADKTAWAKRLTEPMSEVYKKAINGFKGMPMKGTCMTCTDEQIKQIVDYMVSK